MDDFTGFIGGNPLGGGQHPLEAPRGSEGSLRYYPGATLDTTLGTLRPNTRRREHGVLHFARVATRCSLWKLCVVSLATKHELEHNN